VVRARSRTRKSAKGAENLSCCSSNGINYAGFRAKGKLKWKSLETTDKLLAKPRSPRRKRKNRRIDLTPHNMTLAKA